MDTIKSNLTCVKFSGSESAVRYKLGGNGDFPCGENAEYSKRDPEYTMNIYKQIPKYLANPESSLPPMLKSGYDGDIHAIIYSWFYLWKTGNYSTSVLATDGTCLKIYNILKRVNGKWIDVTDKYAEDIKRFEDQCREGEFIDTDKFDVK